MYLRVAAIVYRRRRARFSKKKYSPTTNLWSQGTRDNTAVLTNNVLHYLRDMCIILFRCHRWLAWRVHMLSVGRVDQSHNTLVKLKISYNNIIQYTIIYLSCRCTGITMAASSADRDGSFIFTPNADHTTRKPSGPRTENERERLRDDGE